MVAATLTSKGQITVPATVRQALGVGTGDRVEFVEISPGRYEFIAATKSITDLKGMFGPPTGLVSIDDMNAAIVARGSVAG
jgi:AbrB family looped-hinge helix DNA binding protein